MNGFPTFYYENRFKDTPPVASSTAASPRPRKKAVLWAEQECARYRIPAIDLSITLPDGITEEQADHIRREIHREFARYHRELLSAKHEYIIEHVRQHLTEFLRFS